MIRAVVAAGLIAALAPAPAGADSGYGEKARIAYLGAQLEAIRATGAADLATLADEIYQGGRSKCQTASTRLRIACLIELGREVCALRPGTRCMLIADVIVTNLLGENQFVDREARFEIMSAADDFRPALVHELRARYAALVTEMVVSRELAAAPDLNAGIDRFCIAYGHARELPWQRCVAAIIWYVGTEEKRTETR